MPQEGSTTVKPGGENVEYTNNHAGQLDLVNAVVEADQSNFIKKYIMINYLKSEISIIKINSETREVLAIWDGDNLTRVNVETLDENTYNLVTVSKVEEGFFTQATEEEFILRKEKVKESLVELGF
jgi:hypothetical protein